MGEKRVLLVDDNPSDRKIVKLVAEKNGYLATEAADGFQAQEAMNELKFTLFIVDLQMPRMPGLQLVKRIRGQADHKSTPILIMSGRNRPVDVHSAVQTGATDYIVKPMDIQVLEEKIVRLSNGRSQDWKRYEIPEASRSSQVSLFMSTLTVNEIGAEVTSSIPLPVGFSFMYNLDILASKGLKNILGKVEKVSRQNQDYLYSVQFIGLTEKDRKIIRLCCRDLWVSEGEQ
jgi:two-component system, chemotaxis family, chemotaxis protein CheY